MPAAALAFAQGADRPAELATFWAALLQRDTVTDAHGLLLPAAAGQLPLRVFPSGAARTVPARMHLHLTSRTAEDQQRTVDRARALGAVPLDVGQRPEEGHVVLADPEGNPFCVIEPGNRFLAGTGFLGELACDGSRAVGVFWSQALGWPLVWDSGDETAVQSPAGGTKVAWGGGPDSPPTTPARQLLELEVTSVAEAAHRLVSLGAVQTSRDEECAVLLDPDGGELRIVRRSPLPAASG